MGTWGNLLILGGTCTRCTPPAYATESLTLSQANDGNGGPTTQAFPEARSSSTLSHPQALGSAALCSRCFKPVLGARRYIQIHTDWNTHRDEMNAAAMATLGTIGCRL